MLELDSFRLPFPARRYGQHKGCCCALQLQPAGLRHLLWWRPWDWLVDWPPAFSPSSHKADRCRLEEADGTEGTYGFHNYYWQTYQAMRQQVGPALLTSLRDCSEVHATGYSAGASLANLFQWENHKKLNLNEVTFGPFPAWYGLPPDVGCKGKQLYRDDDPVPYLRPREDPSNLALIRHFSLPAQKMQRLAPYTSSSSWIAEPATACANDEPLDEECLRRAWGGPPRSGCSSRSIHYNSEIALKAKNHVALEYITATDAAFPRKP